MPRGAKDARPAKANVEAELAAARKLLKSEASRRRQLEKGLAEALVQQTATSEILRVISRCRTDVQPVFDTIVRSAVRLCDAVQSNVQLFDGELMHWGAQQGIAPEAMDSIRRLYPMRPDRSQAASRAVLARSVVHLPDVLDNPEYRHELALKGGWRSVLSVPIIREGDPIGAITVARLEPGPFSETQIELLKTFADQAVMAIENVRLFQELEARNRDLTEALEQQTATSEILRVISRSPTDLRPVFDAVVQSAAHLCAASDASLYRAEGQLMRCVGTFGSTHGMLRIGDTRPITRGSASGRVMLSREPLHVPDILTEGQREYPDVWPAVERQGIRTVLAVPLLRDDDAIGAIVIRRTETRPFSEKQIALLKTFADQAVIAIENVRLFTELQEKNRALTEAHAQVTEALEQQTATAEILRVISSSPIDV